MDSFAMFFAMAMIATTLASPYALYGGATALRTLPTTRAYSYGVHSSSLITPTQQQYHAQDDHGQYAYGYSEPLSSKQEVRSLDGTTRGSYSYIDAEGKMQTVDYTADADGFHVSGTNLPRAPPLTAELTRPFLATGTTIGATNSANTAILAASHSGQSTAALATNTATTETSGLRVASASSASNKLGALASIDSAVELPDTLENTIGLGTGIAAVPTAGTLYHYPSLPPTLRYRTAAILPRVYTYSYRPLNSGFLSPFYH